MAYRDVKGGREPAPRGRLFAKLCAAAKIARQCVILTWVGRYEGVSATRGGAEVPFDRRVELFDMVTVYGRKPGDVVAE